MCGCLLDTYIPSIRVVSSTLIPRAIVTVHTINFHKHCQIKFGVYVQTHESSDKTIITDHTSGVISLWPTVNAQVIWRFMRLASGQEILRCKWTALPMPNEFMYCAHALSCPDPCGIIFSDPNGQPLSRDNASDDSDDDTYIPSDTDDSDYIF